MATTSASSKVKNPKAAAPSRTAVSPKASKPSPSGAKTPKPQGKPVTQPLVKAPVKPVRSTAKTEPVKSTPAKPAKEKKVKVVRDSFTLPKSELLQITDMKKRAMALGIEVKKSELIRAGLQALSSMADAAFKKALGNVPTIKTGRPSKA
ncbi:MAG: hypothetical protein FJY28_06870 [Betaproteobacteria bacterium]|nr:hypothetical protein [Betaproteobacteria bacterium]